MAAGGTVAAAASLTLIRGAAAWAAAWAGSGGCDETMGGAGGGRRDAGNERPLGVPGSSVIPTARVIKQKRGLNFQLNIK